MYTERYEVVKAGGWSLANGERTRNVMAYILSNPNIHYFIPSAPGSIEVGDTKVTDFLIACYEHRRKGESFEDEFNSIRQQFTDISNGLGYVGVEKHLDLVEEGISKGRNYDWVISRGEAVNGQLWADLLGFRFIDPTELIRFRRDGKLDAHSYQRIGSMLKGGDRCVIPGFYGLGADGKVRTFPRDGSDVTGAVIARGVNASIYRNLTSADGVFSADPRIILNPRLISKLTLKEYRELGNGGVKVLHKDTIVPLAGVGIPINVRHSEKPESEGTMVVDSRPYIMGEGVIGVAGRGGFVVLNIHMYGMNDEIGIENRILQILRKNGISIALTPSDVDHVSIIFDGSQLIGDREEVIFDQIRRRIKPDRLELEKNIGLLFVVGQGIRENENKISWRLASALEKSSIKNHPIGGVSGLSIIKAVDSDKINNAILVAHHALIENR